MRKLASASGLLVRINASLDKHEECEGCVFRGPIRRLAAPAEDGRNWSDALTLRCSGHPTSDCSEIALQVLQRAAAAFNLE
jgi:hypothetical protein